MLGFKLNHVCKRGPSQWDYSGHRGQISHKYRYSQYTCHNFYPQWWDIGQLICPERHFSALVQDCSNSSAIAVELLQSCAKPSKCNPTVKRWVFIGGWKYDVLLTLNCCALCGFVWNWTLLSWDFTINHLLLYWTVMKVWIRGVNVMFLMKCRIVPWTDISTSETASWVFSWQLQRVHELCKPLLLMAIS